MAKFLWTSLTGLAHLDNILNNATKPLLLFKHSTRCIISKTALKYFESNHQNFKEVDFYLLDLLNHRDVSNAIAEKTAVIHQSPQIILMDQGKVIFSLNHSDIANVDLREELLKIS